MATAKRQSEPDLSAGLSDAGARWDDFHQLVRLLERRHALSQGEHVSAPVGGDGPPADEPVRFRGSTQGGFAPRAIDGLRRRDRGDGPPHELRQNLIGLTGPSGALPAHYGILVRERLKQRDTALADFLDLFNHRLVALYYGAWAKYRLAIQYERTPAGRTDSYTRAMQALSGQLCGGGGESRLYYGGHFTRPTRSAKGLEAMLADYLGHPCRVESFPGQWLPVGREARVRLGTGGHGRNNRLGDGVLIGDRAWDLQSKLRIRIGPLELSAYEALLPGTELHQAMRRLIQDYLPSHMDVELRFRIRGGRRAYPLGGGARPGRTLWLRAATDAPMEAAVQLRPALA